MLRKPLRDLPNVGTYHDLAVARIETPVMDVIHMLVKKNISCVPIVDKDGMVLNVFEAVDVITLIKGGDYENLNLTAGKALEKRSEVCTFSSSHETSQANTYTGLPRHLHLHRQRPHGHHLRHDPQVTCAQTRDHRREQATQRAPITK